MLISARLATPIGVIFHSKKTLVNFAAKVVCLCRKVVRLAPKSYARKQSFTPPATERSTATHLSHFSIYFLMRPKWSSARSRPSGVSSYVCSCVGNGNARCKRGPTGTSLAHKTSRTEKSIFTFCEQLIGMQREQHLFLLQKYYKKRQLQVWGDAICRASGPTCNHQTP